MLLETSTFQRGIGSIVVSEKNKNILSNDINETVVNMEFSPSNIPINEIIIQNTQGENTIIIIRDCNFLQITDTRYDALINLDRRPTVYITSLTFGDCTVKKYLFKLFTVATTLTHICCSNLCTNGNSNGLFIYSETHVGPFFKIGLFIQQKISITHASFYPFF